MTKSAAKNRESLERQANKPDWRISKMGYKFDFNADIWQLDGSIKVNLCRAREMDAVTRIGFRRVLCRYAEELSAASTESVLGHFNRYCDYTGEHNVNISGLTNWRASLASENEYYMGVLRAFLIAWHEWGYPGVDNCVVEYLEEQILKGNRKGKSVRSACPYSGPLTQNELGGLISWASSAFFKNELDLEQFAFFLTLVFTGRRSVQIRSLRACDLECREDGSGNEYVVKFPRAKQSGLGFREAFRSIPINEDLFLVLKKQSECSKKELERVLGSSLPRDVFEQIPIFLEKKRIQKIKNIEHLIYLLDKNPDYLHMSRSRSMEMLKKVSVKCTARSERTGEFINFTSRRFRYTKGTNLARRGISGIALAVALDHADTQNIDVYTENTEEMAEYIDEIISPVLAPLAQAFAGKLISSERDALRASDPHSRIKNGKAQNVGSCGTYAFCASGYRSCYTCVSFQAWVDAPHEEVLKEILEEREHQSEIGVSLEVIRSTDRLLLAVQQVITLCEQAKKEVKSEVSDG